MGIPQLLEFKQARDAQFPDNNLILTEFKLRKKIGQKKIGHTATAWIQAGTRCTITEKLSHFTEVETQKKKFDQDAHIPRWKKKQVKNYVSSKNAR